MKSKLLLSILIILLAPLCELANAQNYDFTTYPQIDLNFDHLDLELKIQEDGMIEGEALYDVSFRVSVTDTVRLEAPRMDIQQVFWGDEPAGFTVRNDRLLITAPENYNRGDILKLRIGYRVLPGFGIHSEPGNLTWTSLLPKSTSHWLPVTDHPRVEFTTRITLTYTSGLKAIATGRTTGSEVVSVDKERSVFITESPVPASALAFAVGDFETFQTSAGLHQIHLHHLKKNMPDADERDGILEAAYAAFRNAEQQSETGYPWRTVDIILLDDSRWETKNYGAGVIFAFKNRGNIKAQVQYGVTAQWAGIQIREEQWNESNFITLLQGWFMQNDYTASDSPAAGQTSVYPDFSPAFQSAQNDFLNSDGQALLREVIAMTTPRLFRESRGVLNRYEFARELYHTSGRRFFETPAASSDTDTSDIAADEEPVTYFADYNWIESEGVVDIDITAKSEGVQELVTAILTTRYFDDTQTREISFSGSSETIRMNVNPGIEYMKLNLPAESDIVLEEEKPFMFWINQLRSDENANSRADAAIGLRRFSDNPDLQLAMLDLLRAEENRDVQAEMLRSLAHVTAGASGTDQIFLQRYNESSDPEIKRALIEALGNYPGNEEVIGRLQQAVLRSTDKAVKKAAVESLVKITEPDRFERAAEQLITREEAFPVVSKLLEELALKGKEQKAVSMAGTFLGELNSWPVRESALELILRFETSESFWEERLPALLDDEDPRVRYKAVEGLQYLSDQKREQMVQERLFEEYDGRVAERLKSPVEM